MVIRKYIISGSTFIHGLVEYHNELVKKDPGGIVKGGGIVYVDQDEMKMYLYGNSHEYGIAKLEDVKAAFEKGRLSASVKMLSVYYSTSDSLGVAMKDAVQIYWPTKNNQHDKESETPVSI
jgi:hypothetical protein